MHVAIVVLKNCSDWADIASPLLQVQSLIHLYHTLDASIRDDVTTTYLGDNEINHGFCFYWAYHLKGEIAGSWV